MWSNILEVYNIKFLFKSDFKRTELQSITGFLAKGVQLVPCSKLVQSEVFQPSQNSVPLSVVVFLKQDGKKTRVGLIVH